MPLGPPARRRSPALPDSRTAPSARRRASWRLSPPISITAVEAASRYAPTKSRHSSASSRAAMPVESTRSQNITVTCLRSPEASATGECGIAATEGVDAGLGLSVAISDTSLRSAIARRIFLRSPSTTPRSFRSWSVRSLRTEKSIRFSAKRCAYSDIPSFFEPVRNRLHRGPSSRTVLSSRASGQGNGEFNRQITSVVHRR